MARPTRDIDELIRRALEEEEVDALEGLGGQSMAELLTETFRGRHRRVAAAGVVANLVFFVTGVYAAVAFAQADDVRVMLLWGGTAGLCFGFVIAIKIWYWLEMSRLAVTREVKRLELQVVQLARRLDEK
jgi:hypothetical protein